MSRPAQMILSQRGRTTQRPPVLEHAQAPERLSPVAAELWEDVQAELANCGLITPLDLLALEMLCETYADWLEARAELALAGGKYLTIRDPDTGEVLSVKTHPAVAHYQRAERSMRIWLDAFGMTPASRVRWMATEVNLNVHRDENEAPLDLSTLGPEEREALRAMVERRMGDAIASLRPDVQTAED